MSAISWSGLESFTVPASTSTASSGDDWLRSFKTTVATGLGESFYWPGSAASQGASAASSGELQLGTLRFARSSSVTGGFDNGYLSLHTFRLSIRHIGSAWTEMLTHPNMLDHGSGFGFPQTTRWLVQEGRYTSSGTTTNITFPTPYAVAPSVYLVEGFLDSNNADQAVAFFAFGVSTVTPGGFISLESEIGSSAGGADFFWRSEGTVAF